MHLAVTGAIIYGLMKNREGSRRTNRMIDKIIMYVFVPRHFTLFECEANQVGSLWKVRSRVLSCKSTIVLTI